MIDIDIIFFDVDGTLVDARDDIVAGINYALKRLGLSEKPFDEIVSYIGTGVRDLVRKSVGSCDSADVIDEGVALFGDYYVKHAADKCTLYPYTRETLDYFKGKRKFIVTNRFTRFADATLKGLGIRDYFEDILGGDDETCLKPNACALKRSGLGEDIKMAPAMIVGDMAIDIETGKNAGITTCWVTYGLGKRSDLKGLKPDYIIDDISELKKIIRR